MKAIKMKAEKGTEGRRSPRAGRLLSAAAVLLAVLLAVTAGYAAAKYVIESDASLSAGVDSFKVTSEITYVDAWTGSGETTKAFNNNLGVMVFPSSGGISFTITVENHSDVAVTCSLTLNDGYSFSSSNLSGCTLSNNVITLNSSIPAKSGDTPGSSSASFTVIRDETTWSAPEDDEGESVYKDVDVYTRDLEITVTYAQAE